MWREVLVLHPDPERLDAFVDERLAGRARRRVVAHLARCARCRRAVQGMRAVTRQARALAVPPLDPVVLAGALARRAAGERLTAPPSRVPLVPASPVRAHRIRQATAAAAAIALLVLASGSPAVRRLVGLPPRLTSTMTSGDACAPAAPHEEETMSLRRVLKVVLLGPALAAVGGCDDPASLAATAPPVAALDGARLRGATLTYAWRTAVGPDEIRRGRFARRYARTSLDGAAAMVELESAGIAGGEHRPTLSRADSTYFDATTLTPRRRVTMPGRWVPGKMVWTEEGGALLLRTSFAVRRPGAPDAAALMSVFGRPVPLGRSPASRMGPAPIALVAQALPLAPGWRGAFDVVEQVMPPRGLDVEHWRVTVTGERRVTVGAGAFDAWVVRGRRDAGPQNAWYTGERHPEDVTLWVAKQGGWLLRMESTWVDEDGDPWTYDQRLEELRPE